MAGKKGVMPPGFVKKGAKKGAVPPVKDAKGGKKDKKKN